MTDEQRCEVCGRNREQYEKLNIRYNVEQGDETIFLKEQDITKCLKCSREFNLKQLNQESDTGRSIADQMDWMMV